MRGFVGAVLPERARALAEGALATVAASGPGRVEWW